MALLFLVSLASALLNVKYLSFKYKFQFRQKGRTIKGSGELYVDTTRNLFRLTGKSKPSFGKTQITIIVDGQDPEQRTVTTYLDLKDQQESQCVIFPFPNAADEAHRLSNLPPARENETDAGPVPWVRGREMLLQWDKEELKHVSIMKGDRELRSYEVKEWRTTWPPDEILDPPFLPKFDIQDEWQCENVSQVEDRLA